MMPKQVAPWQWSLDLPKAAFYLNIETQQGEMGINLLQKNPNVSGNSHQYLPSVGNSNYANQLAGYYMLQHRVDPHCLQKHHSDDLPQYAKSLQVNSHSIVLAGDLHKVLGDDPDGMSQLVSQCQLFDAITDTHSPLQFATYQRGQKVFDYTLVTQDLIDSIKRCGYEPFHANIFTKGRSLIS